MLAITPGGSLDDSFDWDEQQRKIIYEHREYHFAMIHFLDDLENNGPRDRDIPRRRKGDQILLIGNKTPSNKLCGVELHKYLIISLLSEDAVNQPGFAKD